MLKTLHCLVLFMALLTCLLVLTVHGEIYHWIDPEGIKHFSNVEHPSSNRLIKIVKEKNIVTGVAGDPVQSSATFKVVKVYDGDSLKVSGRGLTLMVRLVGIDAPESGRKGVAGQPFSQKAKKRLKELVAGGRVSLISHGTGSYNRQLAEVLVKGVHVNLTLLREGLAEIYGGKMPKKVNKSLFLKAEAKAKKRKIGIWSLGSRYESPRSWRRKHPR